MKTVLSTFVLGLMRRTGVMVVAATAVLIFPLGTAAQSTGGTFEGGGLDEPSVLFYSNKPGSGNDVTYNVTLPKDPSTAPTQGGGGTFNFQLFSDFSFGMALCATQSYPEQLSTCTPDSDNNISQSMANHPGTALAELQFYPPGWVQQLGGITGISCAATQWCAALTIFSLAEDPTIGTIQNNTCLGIVGAVEYENFAYLTKNGLSQAAANPVDFSLSGATPDPTKVLLMNSGDQLIVTMHDSPNGLVTMVQDLTTNQTGSMTASAANGFGQVEYDPTGTSCNNLPYDFHPMYSTSSEQTRVIWGAHSGNISFSEDIGHFDFCSGTTGISSSGNCPSGDTEGSSGEPSDADDIACFAASASLNIPVSGCMGTNLGFDGTSYLPQWPDGNTTLHPTSIQLSSPVTGTGLNYDRVAFETDLPRIEPGCNRTTGAGCTIIPTTDDGAPANFYPFFSINEHDQCSWLFGNDIPGLTTNDFGQNNQYGSLLPLSYLTFGGNGATQTIINDYRQILTSNPCPTAMAFASFTAKLEATVSTGSFDLTSNFTLGASSNGINPLTESVTLQVGPYSVIIPAGSFGKNKKGDYVFEGTINAAALQVKINPTGGSSYTFQAQGVGAALKGIGNPVTVTLTIGDNTGTRKVKAQIG